MQRCKFKNKTNMKKIAIAIEGISNSGKTSTIKKVVEKVIEKIKKEKTEAKIQEIKDQILLKEINIEDYTIPKSKKEDISLIISINNNIRIGIESYGDRIDDKNRLITSLKIFNTEEDQNVQQKKCDIILFAMSHCNCYNVAKDIKRYEEVNKTLGYKFDNKIDQNEYDIIWITNIHLGISNEDIQTKCNKKSAELIYELIEKAIKELSE